MATNITSTPTIIQKLSLVSYSYSWAGSTPVGAVSVEVSDDYTLNAEGQVSNPGTWNAIPLEFNGAQVTVIPVTGNTGNGFIDMSGLAGYAIRTKYTATSGTGSISAIINGKVA